ncbi:MAG: FAD-binding protein [Candidatus Electrothrix sp. ATG2]|nr:FAD-binding protein [Candidatus Electrothrix sp. ATG2]
MISRRDFLRISGMASAAALINWQFPVFAREENAGPGEYHAVIIGAGLGGLSCAALMARNGLKPLVIDKRNVPGGYATSFQRDVSGIGSFTCEASLHGITGNPLSKVLLEELGIPYEQAIVPHTHSWSSVYPDSQFAIPQPQEGIPPEQTFEMLAAMLVEQFSQEKGLPGYMQCWGGLLADIANFYATGGVMPDNVDDFNENIDAFAMAYPTWTSMLWKKKKARTKTLKDLLKEYKINDQKLRAILSQSWPYYGLPPSEIPAWLYLMYTGFYHAYGNYYIRGTSQSLSNALCQTIKGNGGKVLLNTEVTEIILAPDLGDPDVTRAVGVKTTNPNYQVCIAGAVVSNAAAPQTFNKLISESVPLPSEYYDYLDLISTYQPSISHFNVWLGVDLADGENDGFLDSYAALPSNTVVYPGYKNEQVYQALHKFDPDNTGFAVLSYDKLAAPDGTFAHSPAGYASITLSMLAAYKPWERFEEDYLAGNKEEYKAEKDRIAEALISLAEEKLLPGLSSRIEMQDASTPLTNVRFTYNNQGAIYGYEQSVENSGVSRLGNRTPIDGLYLSSAWANPGGGLEMVMLSGKETCKCMLVDWGLIPPS